MKKLLISATILTFASTTMLSAGNLAVFEEPAPVAEEAPMGGSNAAWLIPLLLVVGAAVLVSSGNGNGGGNGVVNGAANGAAAAATAQ